MVFFRVFVVVVAVAAAFVFHNNPLLFGKKTGASPDDYRIFTHLAQLDDELFSLSSAIGNDFTGYRNHCLRVLTFTNYFLPDFVDPKVPNAIELAAVALAYHDVGLWTDLDLNYLEPSKHRLEKAVGGSYSAQEIKVMDAIIMEHHKVLEYRSDAFSDAENALINAVRKADWADATMGLIRYGLPAGLLEVAYDKIPEAGFHAMLAGMDARLSPGNKLNGTMEVLKIFKW